MSYTARIRRLTMTSEEMNTLIEDALGLEHHGFDCHLAALAPQLARALEQKIAECERLKKLMSVQLDLVKQNEKYRDVLQDALGALPNEYCDVGDIIKKALGGANG